MQWIRRFFALFVISFPIELLAEVAELSARPGYTQIESTLAFPWFMFFVFLALILIPFLLIIALSWRKSDKER